MAISHYLHFVILCWGWHRASASEHHYRTWLLLIKYIAMFFSLIFKNFVSFYFILKFSRLTMLC